MKFTIIRSKFLDGLKAVQSVVASKGSLPVLQNVLLEANGKELKMTTTDLDISTTSIVECKVEALPGASSVMPICSWQVGSTWLTSILLMLRSFDISKLPM